MNTTIWNEFPLWTFLSDERKCIFKMKMLRNSFFCVFLFSHKIWEIKHFFIHEKCVFLIFFDFSKFFLLQIWTPKLKLLEHFFSNFLTKSSKIFYNLLQRSELFENIRKCQKSSREIGKWLEDKSNHDFPNQREGPWKIEIRT